MKYLALSLFVIIAVKSFSQTQPVKSLPFIAAQDAYKHIGQQVNVQDYLYNGVVVNDTTVVFQVGKNTNTPRLVMIYIPGHVRKNLSPVDPAIIARFQQNQIDLYGTITGTANSPQIIIDGSTGYFAFPFRESVQQ